MKKLKAGIIGLGDIGKKRLKYLQKHPDKFELIGYYDVRYQGSYIPFFSNKQELLDDVDIIFIATPHKFLFPNIVEAIEHDIHVFSEKPPGVNLKETREIYSTLKRHPYVKLKFGFNHRYHQSIIDAYEHGKKLGDLLWLRGVFGKGRLSGWRANPSISCGGILLGQGIHMLDIFNLFISERFTNISAFIQKNKETGLDENLVINLSNGKVVANFHSSAVLWKKIFHFSAGYENGYVSVNGFQTSEGQYGPYDKETLEVYDKGRDVYFKKEYIGEDSWEREIIDFWEDIKKDRQVSWGSINQALEVMRLIDKIYENAIYCD